MSNPGERNVISESATEHRHDVVVVGGGLAGLNAARHLARFQPLLLEREPAVGGRTSSVKSEVDESLVFNLGAQWVPTATRALADDLGIETVGGQLPPPSLYFNDVRVIQQNPVRWFFALPFSIRARVALVKLAAKLQLAMLREKRGGSEYLEGQTLSEWLGPLPTELHDLVSMWTTVAGARTPDELSARAGLEVVRAAVGDTDYHEGDPYQIVPGGIGRITDELARRHSGTIVTSATVEEIVESADSVRVTYQSNGQRHVVVADQCVIAVPGADVLKICPELPAEKRAALEAIPWTRAIGGGIFLEGTAPGPWRGVYWLRAADMTLVNLLFDEYFTGPPRTGAAGSAFSFTISGQPADDVWHLSDEEIAERIRQDFERVFPESKGRVSVPVIRRWEPAYASFPPGFESLMPELARSTDRLHFCGDYLQGLGTEHAVSTARDAAARVENAIRRSVGVTSA